LARHTKPTHSTQLCQRATIFANLQSDFDKKKYIFIIIEVDRGIPDGHSDPTDFDYNYFYKVLPSKGVPIETIPKFDHDRYWGSPSYKVPWGSDKNSWPPILKGNPHK
jgi:hypothetical protein